ncbi:MAG: hypothetical protein U0X93_06295 [Anaerolineales bacterium]
MIMRLLTFLPRAYNSKHWEMYRPLHRVPSCAGSFRYPKKNKVIGLDWILFVISLIALLLGFFYFLLCLKSAMSYFDNFVFTDRKKLMAAMLEHEEYLMPKLATALLIGLLIFIVTRTLFIAADTYSPIDSRKNPQCYDSPCEHLRPINEIAPEIGARVLTLSAFRYYLRSDLFACSTSRRIFNFTETMAKTPSLLGGSVSARLSIYRLRERLHYPPPAIEMNQARKILRLAYHRTDLRRAQRLGNCVPNSRNKAAVNAEFRKERFTNREVPCYSKNTRYRQIK